MVDRSLTGLVDESFAPYGGEMTQEGLKQHDWVKDHSLSMKATGILAYLTFATPHGYATLTELTSRGPDGRYSLNRGIRELVAANRVGVVRARNANGMAGHSYCHLAGVAVPVEVRVRHGGKTDLYRYFDEIGILLYIGVTEQLRKRRAVHGAYSEWIDFVSTSTTRRYETREVAEMAEATAIDGEQPVFNVAGVDKETAGRRRAAYLEARSLRTHAPGHPE